MNVYPKYIITVLLISLISLFVAAQEPDSLLNILKRGKGEEQALACAALSSFHKGSQSDSAIYYGLKGVQLAKETRSDRALVRCYFELGDSYMSIDSLDAAKKYFLEAIKHFSSKADTGDIILTYPKLVAIHAIKQEFYQAMNYNWSGLELAKLRNDKSAIASFYNNMGIIERNVGLNNEALKHFQLAITMFEPDEISKQCGTFGNIGLIYFDRKAGDSAKYYFTKALKMAEELNDSYLISNMLINLCGLDLELLGNMTAAKAYCIRAFEAIDKMEKTNTKGSAALNRAYASMFLGQVLVGQKKYNDAEKYFTEAEKLAASIPNYEILQHLYPKVASLAELKENPDKAAQFYRKYVQLMDETKKRDSKENTLRMVFEEQKKYELELEKQEKQLLQEKLKSKELSYILLLVVIFSFLAGTITLARMYWLKARRRALEQELTLVQKQKLEEELYTKKEELDFKKRELSTFTLEMVRKNNLIKNVAGRLKDIQSKSELSGTQQIGSLANEIQREEQNKILKEFEFRFNEVHTDFYKKLSTEYPDLTAGDLRLCAFLRLQMTIKDISSITFQSPESLKTARYRLRRKLKLSKGENLTNFLSRF